MLSSSDHVILFGFLFLLYWFLFSWMFSCSPKSAKSFQHCFLTPVWKHFQSSALSLSIYDDISPFPCFSIHFHYPHANCFSMCLFSEEERFFGLCNGCSLCLERSSSWSLCGCFFFFSDLHGNIHLKIFFDHSLWRGHLFSVTLT